MTAEFREAQAVLERALQLWPGDPAAAADLLTHPAITDEALPLEAQLSAESLRSRSAFALGDHDAAARHAQRACVLGRRQGNPAALAELLLHQAKIQETREHYEEVLVLLDEVLELLAGAASPTLAAALNLKAETYFYQGRYREASAVTVQEAEVRGAVGDHAGHAKCLNNLGLISTELGDLPRALEYLLRCFDYIAHCPTPLDDLVSACLINIGHAHQILGEFDKAADSFVQGVDAAQRIHQIANEIAGVTGLGLVAKEQGLYKDALNHLLRALHLAQTHGRRQNEAEILDNLGQVYAALEQPEFALETYERALALAEDLGAVPSQQNTLFNLGRLHVLRGDPLKAATCLEAALHFAEQSGSERAALSTQEELAKLRFARQEFEVAAQHFQQALALERSLRDQDAQQQLLNLTTQLEVERAKHQAEAYRLMNETAQRARAEAEQDVLDRTEALEQAQREIVARLGLAAEYRDDKTGNHTQRVANFAAMLAQAINMPGPEIELLRSAARLHDVGKIGIPDAILLKAGRLTEEEFTIMKHHTTIGARVLEGSRSALMQLAEKIAITHHERWDGQGYPHGLSGEDIPLVGRIVAIADVWDALTTERSYKAAWTPEEAWRELSSQSGKQFDPYLLEIFLGVVAGSFHSGTALEAAGEHALAAESALTLPQNVAADPAAALPWHVVQRVSALTEAAWQKRMVDPAHSASLAQEAYTISEQHGDQKGQAYALRTLAFHSNSASEFRAALDQLDRAVLIAQASGDLTLERDCKNMLGNVYRNLYNTNRAVECLLESSELSRQLGDLTGEANALSNLGVLMSSRLSEFGKALEYYQQAYEVHQRAENVAGQANCLYNMADAYQELGRYAEAHHCAELAAGVTQQLGDVMMQALSTSVMARALDAQQRFGEAAPLHQQALDLLEGEVEVPEALAWIRLYRAANLEGRQQFQEAQSLYQQVLAASEQYELREVLTLTHAHLTLLYKRLGNWEAAMLHLEAERAAQQSSLEQQNALKTRALVVQYEVERAESEAELYKLRSVELASANVALEQANREKSALVAALQEQSQLMERQLREDSLTGVFNRRHIEKVLDQEFDRHRAEARVMCVVMLDIDHFKLVNDSFSHLVGDEVLRRMGTLLMKACRPGDAAGRYGGEEFVLVLPSTTLPEAARLAEELRVTVAQAPWNEIALGLQVTLSLGVAASQQCENFERLVGQADAKLYEAKVQRNRVAS